MKAYLILEDGTVFEGTSIGTEKEVISEVVFNTSMWGYLEVLTDPSYAGQAVCMTYPLIGNYGICYEDMESLKPWPDAYIVHELSRTNSNFRSEGSIQDFLVDNDIPGIAGIDTRALTKILRNKGTMNGMITTKKYDDLDEVLPKIKEYKVRGVVDAVTCDSKKELESLVEGKNYKVALLDVGAKNNIPHSLQKYGCDVTVFPAPTFALLNVQVPVADKLSPAIPPVTWIEHVAVVLVSYIFELQLAVAAKVIFVTDTACIHSLVVGL